MVDGATITAIIGASVLVIVTGAFLGVGFILALLAMLWAILSALLSNLWRVLRGTLQSAINFFTFPLALQWGFTALILIWLLGLPVIEFQNETMQSLDVFYECFVYDTIDNFVDKFAIPFRNFYNFLIPRWNDLILYIRDCIQIVIDEFPDIIDPSIPTPTEIVEAFCAVVDGFICFILFPVSIESFEIPFFTDVLRGYLDIVVCFIQLLKDFISAIILDPLGFFDGPCFIILSKFVECFRIFMLWITASGFNGLLDDFINSFVDNVACYLFWGKALAIDIVKLDLVTTWVDRGEELCMCIGDTFELATGGLLPGIGDFVECICIWIILTLEEVFMGTLFLRLPEFFERLCNCIEDHLLPLFDTAPLFGYLWTDTIDFILCLCRFLVRLLTASRDFTFISGDCYMCQRCPTCKVSADAFSDNCALSQQDVVGFPPEILFRPFSYSKCAGANVFDSCSECCDRCQQYCDCSDCHDFVDEFVSCFCAFIESIAFQLLDEIPFGIDFGDLFLLACDILVKTLNLWRPVVRGVFEFSLCRTGDLLDGVQEILFAILAILDCTVEFISMGEDCEAFSPIPIPVFIPIPPGICDNFVFVLFLQILEFILDLIFGLGIIDIINAIICIVTTGYDVCIGIFPNGQGGSCDLSGCWDDLASCIAGIGGIWTPILPPNPFFDNISLVVDVFDFVLCPIRDILNCWTTFSFQGVVMFSTLDDVVTGISNSLICTATVPVGTAASLFPFASLTSVINPLLDIYNVFFTNVPSNPFGQTRFSSFSSFFTFLNGLFGVQWVGLPLLDPWLRFIFRPAFDLFNCLLSSFNETNAGFTSVGNIPNNIVIINSIITSFLDCVRNVSINGILVFRPLIEIVLFPLIFMWRAVMNIINPRPANFNDVFNRLIQMCTNLSLIQFGSDGVAVMRWIWDFVLLMKSVLNCLFSTPSPGPGLINALTTFNGGFGGGIICISNLQYSSPGIALASPFFNFFRGFTTISNFIVQAFSYFFDLFFWIGCLSEVGGCCSNPVTETSEFISEVEEIAEAITCLFEEFPGLLEIPCFPDGTCKRSDPASSENAQESLERLRILWDNYLEVNMTIPRNSTCGEILYGILPGEINETKNWVESTHYFSCIGMLKLGDSMIKQNSSLTHQNNFDCPTNAFTTVLQQLKNYNETDDEGMIVIPTNGTTNETLTKKQFATQLPPPSIEENEITFETFLKFNRDDADADADAGDNESMYYKIEELGINKKEGGTNTPESNDQDGDEMDEEKPLTQWREMYVNTTLDETPEWVVQLMNSTIFRMLKRDFEKLESIAHSGEMKNEYTGMNYTKEEIFMTIWNRTSEYINTYENWRDEQDRKITRSSYKKLREKIKDTYEKIGDSLNVNKELTNEERETARKRIKEKYKLPQKTRNPEGDTTINADDIVTNFSSIIKKNRKKEANYDHFLLGIRNQSMTNSAEIRMKLHRKLFGLPELPPRKRPGLRYGIFLTDASSNYYQETWHRYLSVKDHYRLIHNIKQSGQSIEGQEEGEEEDDTEMMFIVRDGNLKPSSRKTKEFIKKPGRLLPAPAEPFNYNIEALKFFDALWETLFGVGPNFWSDNVARITMDLDFTKDVVEPIINFIFRIVDCEVPEDFDGTNFYNPFCYPLLPEGIFNWIQPLPTNILRVQIPWPQAIITENCEGQGDGNNCPSDPECNRPLCPTCDYGERDYGSCRDEFAWTDAFDNIFYFFVGIPRWWDAVFIHDDTTNTTTQFWKLFILFPFIFLIPGDFGIFTFPFGIPLLLPPSFTPTIFTFTFYIPYFTPFLWALAGWGLSFAFKFPSISSFNVSNFITDLVNNFSLVLDILGTFFGLDITDYLLIKAQKVAYPVGTALPNVDTFCFYWTLSNFAFGVITLILGSIIIFAIANAVASLFLFLFALFASLGLIVQSAILRFLNIRTGSLEVRANVTESIFRQMLAGGGRPALAIAESIGVHLTEREIQILNNGINKPSTSTSTSATAPVYFPNNTFQSIIDSIRQPRTGTNNVNVVIRR